MIKRGVDKSSALFGLSSEARGDHGWSFTSLIFQLLYLSLTLGFIIKTN